MKNSKLAFFNGFIFASFILLGFFFGGDVALLIYLFRSSASSSLFTLLFFIDNLASIGFVILVACLLWARNRYLAQQASTKEYFQNEHFVYTETAFLKELSRKAGRRHFHGCVGALAIKDLNSEVLSLYGGDAVKDINEIIFGCIYNRWVGKKEYLYAYSFLDGFLIYKKTDEPREFYKELADLVSAIDVKIQENGALPSLKILLGAYQIAPNDTAEQSVRRACFAEKYNASTRLSDDVVVFSKDMLSQSDNTRDLSYELTRAIEEGQFEVFYQPKYDLKKDKFYGAEALIRWNHPIRGLLPPSLFIPFAEQSGRIIDIDRYVFRHVCMDISKWEKDKNRLVKISVNLSRKSVYDPGLLDYFRQTMAEYKVNPLLIDIELTESVASKDAIYTAAIIRRLKEMGFVTSIDDFGVGYSSFFALRKIPFDTLKIDKAFIDDIEVDKKARDMVQAVIQIGHSLEMGVIAEGVQSEKQVDILKKMDLDYIQGYYYSKPLKEFEYLKFLENNVFEKNRGNGK